MVTIGLSLRRFDLALKSYPIVDPKMLRILFKILMHDMPWDELAGLHTKGSFVHWEIAILVSAQHVVRP